MNRLFKRILFPLTVLILLLLLSLFINFYPNYSALDILDHHIPIREILFTGILFTLTWLAIRLLEIFLWEGIIESRIEKKVPKLLKSIVHSLIFFIVVIFALGFIFNQSITGLVATTSAVGIILGIGLRSTLEATFNGLALSVDRFFQIGDVVLLQKVFDKPAKVEEITWRYTVFQDSLSNQITVPNNTICNSIITNYSRPTHITRNELLFTISVPNASIQRIRSILEAALHSTEMIVNDPEPFIYIVDIDDTRIKYQLNFWFNSHLYQPDAVKNELYNNIIRRFIVAGIDLQVTSWRYHEKELSVLTPEENVKMILKKTDLFSQLSEEDILAIADEVKTHKYKPGHILIKQGAAGDSMYVLAEGLLKGDVEDAETQKVFTVAKIHPGEFFGEMSLFFGDPRSATVTALTESIVFEITKETMQKIFESHPHLIEALSNKIADRHVINLKKKQSILEKDVAAKTQGYSDMFRKMINKWFWNKEE